MPSFDGLMATRAICKLPSLDGCVIVAVSANVFQKPIGDAFAAGVDYYITKPITVSEFPDQIEKHIRAGRVRHKPTGAAATNEQKSEIQTKAE